MKKILKIFLMTAVTAVMCVAFAACGDGGSAAAGESVGSFTSTDLEGNEVTEAIFAEKDVTILNSWGTFCDPCKEEMPELSKMDETLPENVQIIGVVTDATEGDDEMIGLAKEICEGTGVTYTNIVMNDSMMGTAANVDVLPTTFIVDKEGNLVCDPIVGANVNAYEEAVQTYLEQLK